MYTIIIFECFSTPKKYLGNCTNMINIFNFCQFHLTYLEILTTITVQGILKQTLMGGVKNIILELDE